MVYVMYSLCYEMTRLKKIAVKHTILCCKININYYINDSIRHGKFEVVNMPRTLTVINIWSGFCVNYNRYTYNWYLHTVRCMYNLIVILNPYEVQKSYGLALCHESSTRFLQTTYVCSKHGGITVGVNGSHIKSGQRGKGSNAADPVYFWRPVNSGKKEF